MKMKVSTIILIIICAVGLCLMLYPAVSNYWNTHFSTRAINDYVSRLDSMEKEDYSIIWNEAIEYNKDLNLRNNKLSLTDELRARYENVMNIGGDGLIGYVEIKKIGVTLPVYHGLNEKVLQTAIGHIDWSSMPTGGEGNHCVISGHRGLPTAKLFSDLDMLCKGDLFTLTVLDEVLTYEVDLISVIEPDDVSELLCVEGKDYCSLLTCTPYGVNTHRLVVRGHRVENSILRANVISEASEVSPLVVAPAIAGAILFVPFAVVMLKKPKKR